MHIPILQTADLNLLTANRVSYVLRDYFYPQWEVKSGPAVQPYCDGTEFHWERTEPDQTYWDKFYIIPFFDQAGKQLQLINQKPRYCKVVYKTYMERTGIAISPNLVIDVITPPVLGITPKGNEAVFLNWPRQGSVEDMRSLCEQARQAFRSSLFALSVRALELDYYNIPALT